MFNTLLFLEELQGAREIDFNKMYEEFNKKFFGDILPKKMPIEIKSVKTGASAYALWLVNKHSGYTEISKIVISPKYKRDVQDFAKLLLHEMVHIYFYVKYSNWHDYNKVFPEYEKDSSHNHVFMDKLKEISEKSGIDIPKRDALENVELARKPKDKQYNFIVTLSSSGKSGITVTTSGVIFQLQLQGLAKYWNRHDPKTLIAFGSSKDVRLQKFPITKSIKTISAYTVDKDLLSDLMDAGQVFDVSELVKDV